MVEVLLSKPDKQQGNTSQNRSPFIGHSRNIKDDSQEGSAGGRPVFSSKLAKLEFPKYSSEDLTKWSTCVDQFFEYQGTPENRKVSMLHSTSKVKLINGGCGFEELTGRREQR